MRLVTPALRCGCPACRLRMEREFHAIIKRSYTYSEVVKLRHSADEDRRY